MESFLELFRRAERGRPDALLDGNHYRIQINALHYEIASIFLEYRSLADFQLPLVQLSLVNRPRVEAPIPVVVRSVLLMLLMVVMVTSAATLVVAAPIVIVVVVVTLMTVFTRCSLSPLTLPVIVVGNGCCAAVIAHRRCSYHAENSSNEEYFQTAHTLQTNHLLSEKFASECRLVVKPVKLWMSKD